MKLMPLITARLERDFRGWDLLRIAVAGWILGPRLQERVFNLIADAALFEEGE